MNSILVKLLTMQYKIWHTLDIDTLKKDVAVGAITADEFDQITKKDSPDQKGSDLNAPKTEV